MVGVLVHVLSASFKALACWFTLANLGSPAHSAPSRPLPKPGTVEADLIAIRKSGSWPLRMTFLGWTTDDKAVYRRLECWDDQSGARTSSCLLDLCVAAAASVPTKLANGESSTGDCTPLLAVSVEDDTRSRIRTLGVVDIEPVNATERGFIDADVLTTWTAGLAKVGELKAGRKPPHSVEILSTECKSERISVGIVGRPGTIVEAYRFSPNLDDAMDRCEEVKPGATVLATSESPGSQCVFVGAYVRRSENYEGVDYSHPVLFEKVLCTK